MEGKDPKEKFLIFLPNCGLTGNKIATEFLQFLENYNINVQNCRGQLFDNAPVRKIKRSLIIYFT